LVRVARRALLGAVALASLAGCATLPNADPRDPLEPFNRGVFAFNEDLDRALFKPAATLYRDLIPKLARTGVSNFFGNLEDVWSFANSVLQFKPAVAAETLVRVGANTVFGLGGVLDVASDMRLQRQREDFGQTLGRWGVPTGPYLVLPLLGPSTLRDALALSVDFYGDVVGGLKDVPTRNALKALDLLDTRASLLSVTDALDQIALDKYSFSRDAFLQRRLSAVFDGNPPEESADEAPPKR
jgi:phospholipid-binding lipoprotein MlaA